jgi:hypothetical protein
MGGNDGRGAIHALVTNEVLLVGNEPKANGAKIKRCAKSVCRVRRSHRFGKGLVPRSPSSGPWPLRDLEIRAVGVLLDVMVVVVMVLVVVLLLLAPGPEVREGVHGDRLHGAAAGPLLDLQLAQPLLLLPLLLPPLGSSVLEPHLQQETSVRGDEPRPSQAAVPYNIIITRCQGDELAKRRAPRAPPPTRPTPLLRIFYKRIIGLYRRTCLYTNTGGRGILSLFHFLFTGGSAQLERTKCKECGRITH